MAKLLIQTQCFENYGAHDWDGVGECPQYWKAKGGEDYVVKNFKAFDKVAEIVMALRSQIEQDTIGFRENIINFEVVEDDYLTVYEKMQLEYEGSIIDPVRELTII